MAAVDHKTTASDVLRLVGGPDNVQNLTHCATRLRFVLTDTSKASDEALEALPGVLKVVRAGGQYQVVIGNEVPQVYAEVQASLGGEKTVREAPATGAERPRFFDRVIQLISSIFSPILWPLAASGLFKAFLTLATQLGVFSPESQTYVILAAASDALFYFLPLFLAVTSANRFKANQFTAMAIAGALVYPSIIALFQAGEPVSFAGIPVVMMSYTGSVVPIILAVWIQSHFERLLSRILPAMIRSFTVPFLTLAIMVPLVLMTVGPITTTIAQLISEGIAAIFTTAPAIAGAIIGGGWPFFVMFGLHWGFVPLMTNDLATLGYSVLFGPTLAAVLAQGAATFAVFLRTRSQARRAVAGPSTLSAFLAGVNEPGIYGVNLPLKLPFAFGIVGGLVGGAIIAAGGSAATSFILASILTIPAFAEVGDFTMVLIGAAAAIVISFTLTFIFVNREQRDVSTELPDPDPATTDKHAEHPRATTGDILAPVSGTIVALGDIRDPVFSSGALGNGLGIIPSDGRITSPISGTVQVAMDSGHAYGIAGDDGIEVLVHVGIDTVQLDGRGFSPAVTVGQHVTAGDLLTEINLEVVKEAGFDSTTVLLVTNSAQFSAVSPTGARSAETGTPVIGVER